MARNSEDAGPVFDLFGDPVPRNHGSKGRPEHVPTDANRRIVVLAYATGKKDADVAKMLGITVPTLKKHYFSEWSLRHSAKLRADGVILARLDAQSRGGNVAATKALDKKLERSGVVALSEQMASRSEPNRKAAKGVKEQRKDDAAGVAGIYAPPTAPSLIN